MKRLLCSLLALVSFVLTATAATVQFTSADPNITVTGSLAGESTPVAPTLVNPVHSVWATIESAPWISYSQTGVGSPTRPNGSTMTFVQPLGGLAGAIVTSMKVTVLSDDTSSGYVRKGSEVFTLFTPSNIAPAPACIQGTPGCVSSTLFQQTFTDEVLLALLATPGAEFVNVQQQLYGDVSGSAWKIEIETRPGSQNVVPEPGTYALIGIGCVALALFRRRHS